MNVKKVSLTLGWFFAVIHVVWSLAVAIIPAGLQSFTNWILVLHHINLPIDILTFNLANAIILVIVAFIYGYLLGWVFATLWNKFVKAGN